MLLMVPMDAQEERGLHLEVTASPAFSRLSTNNEGLKINFLFRKSGRLKSKPFTRLRCDYTDLEFIISHPNGEAFHLSLEDRLEESGYHDEIGNMAMPR